MTNKEQIIYSLLPRAEGLLLGTICGMEIENFNREGAAKTLTDAIALLHKVRLLLEQEPNSEPSPLLQQAGVMRERSAEPLPEGWTLIGTIKDDFVNGVETFIPANGNDR